MGFDGFDGDLLPSGEWAGPFEIGDPKTMGATKNVDTFNGRPWTLAEIEEHLVLAFRDSTTRPALYSSLLKHIEWASLHAPCALFLISGQFVANLENPSNAHLAVIITGDSFNMLDELHQWQMSTMYGDREVQLDDGETITLDIVRHYPPDHPFYEASVANLAAARYLCQTPLDDDRLGGYIHLVQCEGGGPDAAIISLLAGSDISS